MSDAAGTGAITTPDRPLGRRWLPFWILQAAELAVAVAFVDVSVHVSNGGLLIVGAAVFAGLAVTAKGPLGLLRLANRRLHLILIIVAAALILVAPIVPAFRPDIEGIIVIAFATVGLIRLATLTNPDTVVAVGRRRTPVIDTSATVGPMVTPEPAEPPAPARATSSGPSTTGRTASTSSSLDAAGRWLGRTTGAAAASGKRVVEEHGPEAGARVRRSIRSAGRVTGRLGASHPDRDTPTD
jgi:hypothetical protein